MPSGLLIEDDNVISNLMVFITAILIIVYFIFIALFHPLNYGPSKFGLFKCYCFSLIRSAGWGGRIRKLI